MHAGARTHPWPNFVVTTRRTLFEGAAAFAADAVTTDMCEALPQDGAELIAFARARCRTMEEVACLQRRMKKVCGGSAAVPG